MKNFSVFWSGLFLVLAMLFIHECAKAEIHYLDLARIQITNGNGIVQDSYIVPPRAQGRMRLETDSRNVIRGLEWDAWFRGDDQPIFDDWVIVLDYTPNGARYEVMSLLSNEQYYITIIRRAPPDDGFDPAFIFQVETSDGDVILTDFRYRSDE